MSTHQVNVIKVKLEKHPNADTLSIVRIGGYQCIVKTTDFKDGDLATYIPPDYVVPEKPEYEFLRAVCKVVDGTMQNGNNMKGFRVKTKKFRKEMSQGLLVKAPEGSKEGDDVMFIMDIGHYEPPLPVSIGGWPEHGPSVKEPTDDPNAIYAPEYDLEPWHKYNRMLVDGEEVIITEKIHGANGRFVWWKDDKPHRFIDKLLRWFGFGKTRYRLYCGSHHQWKVQHSMSAWWRASLENPDLFLYLSEHPGRVVYAEVYGDVQDLKYGARKGQLKLAVFDILENRKWVPMAEWNLPTGVETVPVLYKGPYSEQKLRECADGPSMVKGADNVREGCVIQPVVEREDTKIGRVKLKMVSSAYLERA